MRRALLAVALLALIPQAALAQDPPEDPPVVAPRPDAGTIAAPPRGRTSTPGAELPRVKVQMPAVAIPTPSPVPGGPAQVGQEELLDRLEARFSYLRKGDVASADVELGHIFELKDQVGEANLPLASSTLVHHAVESLSKKDPKRALLDLDAALRLSPDMTQALWLRARALYASPEGGLVSAFRAGVAAAIAELKGFRNQVALATELVGVLLLTLLGVALVFTAIQSLRYARCAAYDIAQRLPEWAGIGVGYVILALVAVLPLALNVGIVGLLVCWLAIAMFYQSPRERAVGLALSLSLAISPLVVWGAGPLIQFHGSYLDRLTTLATEAFAPDAEIEMNRVVSAEKRRDYDAAFLLGLRARQRGDFSQAETWYTAALAARPGDAAASNNLGTVLYLQRKSELAQAAFNKAAATRSAAEPFLNVATLHLEKSRFDDAKTAIDSAGHINPTLAAHYNEAEGSTAQRLYDMPYPQSSLWGRLFDSEPKEREAITAELFSLVGGRAPWLIFSISGAVLALLAFAVARGRRSTLSTPCPKCGQPAPRRTVESLCDQCHSIFMKAVAVEPSMRLEKENAIRRFQMRQRWLERGLSLIAGAGQLVAGRAIEGTIVLSAFVALFAYHFLRSNINVHSWFLSIDLGPTYVIGAGIAAGILVLFSLKRALDRG
ncbi:MAG: hypothetical protein U1E65_31350 [Myxococcota bacterium]